MNKETYIQNIVVTVENGTAAESIRSLTARLNPDYPYIKSLIVNSVNDGGDPNYRIGIDHGTSVVEEPHHNANWQTGNVAHHEKWRPMNLKHVGNDLKIITEIQALLTAELKYEITFELSANPC